MNTIRLQLRFLLPLVLVLGIAASLALPVLDRLTLRWFSRDLDLRGTLVANALSDSVADALREGRGERLGALFQRSVQDERLVAIGLCLHGEDLLLQRSSAFPPHGCDAARQATLQPDPQLRLPGGPVHVSQHPVNLEGQVAADLVLMHDLSFIERRSRDTQNYLIAFIVALGASIALITVVVAQLSWRGWVDGARALLRGEGLVRPPGAAAGELAPLAAELRGRLRDLEDEHRRSLGPRTVWDASQLRSLLLTQLRGDQVIVVSNREPYIHEHTDAGIVVRHPASGLVTAIEPVMRACSGTWIAHGSGSADRSTVDAHDRVSVPPETGEYWLRRVWLTGEQERGYYYGFANEGMWPLCHVAHVRPLFRDTDWQAYQEVNRVFADAVVAEARGEDPVVLVQDYHFALVPALIRERLPRATVITFWHIPWPNPESFGICPWSREILRGLLGSTILGFHTRYHCKNFMETVDRHLEARIEAEHSTISHGGRVTLVESYPISISWPEPVAPAAQAAAHAGRCREAVFARERLRSGQRIAVGVDRFDYTKGILERLHAVERLLAKHPQWVGVFSLVQVAAPSRGALEEYQVFQQRVNAVVERINGNWGRDDYRPVHLLARHHEHDELAVLYRAADVCLVTSLHDGMNLVCKEFVAARDDEQGVLVLSRFAGAAREMPEALIVNPYHVEEMADALHRALSMPAGEQRERMANLRATVREFNIYRWAGRILADAARWRLRERIDARVARHGGAGPHA